MDEETCASSSAGMPGQIHNSIHFAQPGPSGVTGSQASSHPKHPTSTAEIIDNIYPATDVLNSPPSSIRTEDVLDFVDEQTRRQEISGDADPGNAADTYEASLPTSEIAQNGNRGTQYTVDRKFLFYNSAMKSTTRRSHCIESMKAFKDKIYIRMRDSNYIEEMQEDGKVIGRSITLLEQVLPFVLDFTITQDTGAIWFTCKDNSVWRCSNGKGEEIFRTKFLPRALYTEFVDDNYKVYVCSKNGLEIRNEHGESLIEMERIPFIRPSGTSDDISDISISKNSERILVVCNRSYAILFNTSYQQQLICPTDMYSLISCGCFKTNGDIILGTNKGLCELSKESNTQRFISEECIARGITCLPNNKLLIYHSSNTVNVFS